MIGLGLTEWALQTGLAITVLVGLILIIRRPFTKVFGAGATYALWSLPLIRLFMPSITLPAFQKEVPSILTEINLVQKPIQFTDIAQAETNVSGSFNIWFVVTGLWLGIAALWFIYQVCRQSVFMSRLRRETSLVPQNMWAEIDAAMTVLGLKTRPDIRLARDKMGPMVTGISRPIIILPHNFYEDYTPQQRHFALVHELAHIKRHDLWAAFLVLGFRAINWPNPLIHYAAHKFRADQEAACDAFVLSKVDGGITATQSYAETLVHAATSTRSHLSPAPLGLALAPHNKGESHD